MSLRSIVRKFIALIIYFVRNVICFIKFIISCTDIYEKVLSVGKENDVLWLNCAIIVLGLSLNSSCKLFNHNKKMNECLISKMMHTDHLSIQKGCKWDGSILYWKNKKD